ncbi:hypothetical protein N7539_008078 [Penicillium diatomitis]|uniref:Mitochondrial respiratory complex I chaperone (Cia84) n=1 Tax=Penicillium diatomitis TaxID=2819901 RepID=A0A9W9WTV0_9EURO|nr:uncharacterized protein N7539_008078 [Penicillium diatomitis]KAJ5475012.1 hypothetical protein N7539_008078 [Penicillium diatomitis]
MQSHLSRRVFRALINNEPLSFSRCRRTRLLHSISPARTRPSIAGISHVQSRSLFAFSLDPKEVSGEVLPATLTSEKGLKPMTDLKRSLEDKSRAPPDHTLAEAFKLFFETRVDSPGVINSFQARLLSMTWKHLKSRQEELDDDDWHRVFSVDSLERVLFVFSEAQCLPEASETILRLARYAYLELCADHGFGANKISRPALLVYINLLAVNGHPEDARQVIINFGGQLRGAKPSPWLTVLKGFALKDDQRQMRKIVQELDKHGVTFDQASHQELVEILIAQGLFKAAQTIYECPVAGKAEPSLAAKEAVIRYALLNGENAWAQPIYHSLIQGGAPNSETIGTALLWKAAQGANASALEEQVAEWNAKNPRVQDAITISDINMLLRYANAQGDSNLATSFASLVNRWRLVPDEQTHLLQLESAIQAADVEASLHILEKQMDPHSLSKADPSIANQLVTMLCMSEEKDELFQKISSLLDPLFQDGVYLEASTIAALTRMLLYRHDNEAVSELLRPRLANFDSEGKTLIRRAVTDFILDLQETDEDAWDVYELFKLAFPDTGVSVRTEIMSAFFERKRSDLAVMVFGHMRQADDLSRRPKPDTYARCFQGIARNADATNLELVHNMLKLDLEVELNTRILNGLMLAYAACGMADKSMNIFRQILQSDEGPSTKTIALFFKVCEKHHNGVHEATKMMSKVKKLEIEVDRRLYSSYIEALAAQCEFDRVTEAINNMQSEIGVPPTSTTIGLFYNAIPYQYWKDQVEEWARKTYPELWEHLAQMHRSEHEDGQRFDAISNEIWV